MISKLALMRLGLSGKCLTAVKYPVQVSERIPLFLTGVGPNKISRVVYSTHGVISKRYTTGGPLLRGCTVSSTMPRPTAPPCTSNLNPRCPPTPCPPQPKRTPCPPDISALNLVKTEMEHISSPCVSQPSASCASEEVSRAPCNFSTAPKNVTRAAKLPLDFEKGFEDRLFHVLLKDCEDTVALPQLLEKLKNAGLREDDMRLRGMYKRIRKMTSKDPLDPDCQKNIRLDKQSFAYCVQENLNLIKRAAMQELVIPNFRDFSSTLDEIYCTANDNTNGVVDSKIPQLAKYTADSWGVSMCTIDGQRYSKGDSKVPFSLQACCLPFAYSLAIRELGADTVHQYVGLEHNCNAVDQIVLDQKNQPNNPMIDAGGIVVSSLIKTNLRSADRFEFMLQEFKRMAAGESLGFNNSVFLSEREVSDRENALSYYMKQKQCFPEGVTIQETLDLYGQMTSIEASCDSVSVMAATMANGGICPLTGEKLLDGNTIRYTLALMHSCGMNKYSGPFSFYVGLPCKSSSSGGLIIVIPNVGGMCMWSPPLDMYGNSVRGLQFSRDLVTEYNFHNFDSRVSKNKRDPRRHECERDINPKVQLLFSAQHGNLGALQMAALSGHDMAGCDYDMRTALHLAAAEGHLEVVQFLVDKCGVAISPVDRFDHTPLDEATRNHHDKVKQFLESKMPCM